MDYVQIRLDDNFEYRPDHLKLTRPAIEILSIFSIDLRWNGSLAPSVKTLKVLLARFQLKQTHRTFPPNKNIVFTANILSL